MDLSLVDFDASLLLSTKYTWIHHFCGEREQFIPQPFAIQQIHSNFNFFFFCFASLYIIHATSYTKYYFYCHCCYNLIFFSFSLLVSLQMNQCCEDFSFSLLFYFLHVVLDLYQKLTHFNLHIKSVLSHRINIKCK